MTVDGRYTWEKLVLELKLLRAEDFGSLVPLCLGVQCVLWPNDPSDTGFRSLQFLGFQVLKACEGKDEAGRWETLRDFLFNDKNFQLETGPASETSANSLLLRPVLEQRQGHPLAIVFLLLHMAHLLDLPMALIQARHHFLIKWVRSGKTIYLDVYNEARPLTDQDLVRVLNHSASSLEVWSARQLMAQYLELLRHTFDRTQDLGHLHVIYNILLQLDDTNTAILGHRALLRQKLGFSREALADLKRYFSFIERSHAPIELQQAWLDLESTPEPQPRNQAELLH